MSYVALPLIYISYSVNNVLSNRFKNPPSSTKSRSHSFAHSESCEFIHSKLTKSGTRLRDSEP